MGKMVLQLKLSESRLYMRRVFKESILNIAVNNII